ncbi:MULTISPECIES: hypothetical protein [unclassified Microcoleus]|uniref:hypothetical protein n=1 Tax=unclassified Microcoleus TaxID=2642155 RepID=UPI002FD2D8A6
MPVPQENLSFVERASCPFLRMVQDVRFNGWMLREEVRGSRFEGKISWEWRSNLLRKLRS